MLNDIAPIFHKNATNKFIVEVVVDSQKYKGSSRDGR